MVREWVWRGFVFRERRRGGSPRAGEDASGGNYANQPAEKSIPNVANIIITNLQSSNTSNSSQQFSRT